MVRKAKRREAKEFSPRKARILEAVGRRIVIPSIKLRKTALKGAVKVSGILDISSKERKRLLKEVEEEAKEQEKQIRLDIEELKKQRLRKRKLKRIGV